jgi:hypothetical protein
MHVLEQHVGWAKPTGRANARPMTGSASPPFNIRAKDGGHGASAPLPTLRSISGGGPTFRFECQTAEVKAVCSRGAESSESCQASRPNRAQGKLGARHTHSLACEMRKAHERSHYRFAETIRPSLRNGFNGFLRAPRRPGFFATVVREIAHELDTCVGVSGPHDFAVRG